MEPVKPTDERAMRQGYDMATAALQAATECVQDPVERMLTVLTCTSVLMGSFYAGIYKAKGKEVAHEALFALLFDAQRRLKVYGHTVNFGFTEAEA